MSIVIIAIVAVIALPVIIVAAYAAYVIMGALLGRAERWVDNALSALLCEIDFLAQRLRR